MAGVKGRSGTKGKGKTGQSSHRTESARAEDRAKMMALMRRGYSQNMIAQELGVHQSTVSLDFKIVMKQLVEQQTEDTKALLAVKLEEYREVKREAWEAWDRSKRNAMRTVEEHGRVRKGKDAPDDKGNSTGSNVEPSPRAKAGRPNKRPGGPTPDDLKGDLEVIRRTETREGRLPDASYLRIVLACMEAERELLNLNPAKEFSGKVEMTSTASIWAAIAAGIPEGPVPDAVEEAIARALGHDPDVGGSVTQGTPEGEVIDQAPPVEYPGLPPITGSTPTKGGSLGNR